jgi:transcriptional regulator with XRE-family HTH domain
MYKESTETSLAQLVRQARLARGLSMSELARRSGTAPSAISRTESGTKVPNPETLAALAEVLRIPLSQLYAAAGYPVPQELSALRPYLRLAYGIPEEGVAEIEAYLADVAARYGQAGQPAIGEDEEPDN